MNIQSFLLYFLKCVGHLFWYIKPVVSAAKDMSCSFPNSSDFLPALDQSISLVGATCKISITRKKKNKEYLLISVELKKSIQVGGERPPIPTSWSTFFWLTFLLDDISFLHSFLFFAFFLFHFFFHFFSTSHGGPVPISHVVRHFIRFSAGRAISCMMYFRSILKGDKKLRKTGSVEENEEENEEEIEEETQSYLSFSGSFWFCNWETELWVSEVDTN